MLTKKIYLIQEFFLWLLIYAITFSNAFVEVCIGWVIGLFLIKFLILRNVRFPRTALNLLILLYLCLLAVSFLRSAYFNVSLRGFLKALKYAFVFFAVFQFLKADSRRLQRLFWALIYVSAFTFLNGIFQSFFGFDLLRHREITPLDMLRRMSSSFVHPNDFGAFIITVLPLTFSCFSRCRVKKQKIILFIVLLLGLYCLLKTSSRGAWLGFIIGTMVYFLFYRKKAALLVPIVIVAFIIISPHGLHRLSTLSLSGGSTAWERIELWKGTWNMVREHPILGFGINTFSKYFPLYKPVDYPDVRYAHNSYLQMWSEIGLAGLLTFLAIIFTVLAKCLRNLKKKVSAGENGLFLLGLLAGYIAFLIQSGLDTNLYSLVLITFFWVVTAILLALNEDLEKGLRSR